MNEPIRESEQALKLAISARRIQIENYRVEIKKIEEEILELQKYCEHRLRGQTNYDGEDRWCECQICKKIL